MSTTVLQEQHWVPSCPGGKGDELEDEEFRSKLGYFAHLSTGFWILKNTLRLWSVITPQKNRPF
jgi:hypothetical protein